MAPSLFYCAVRNNGLTYFLNCGKYSATLKADQINVLRQRYDAFLEEDKKRKERNGDILEKLDKMRFSNAVARYKTNIYLDPRVSFNCTEEAPLTPYSHPQMNPPPTVGPIQISQESPMLDVIAKPMDETYIINEISKKYILIPKIKSITPEHYIPKAIKPDNNNDSDWKSKYSILDKLKQNEKEDTTSFSVLKDHGKSFIDDIPTKEHKYRVEDEALVSKHGFADIKTDPIKYSFNSPDQGKANNVLIDDTKGNARAPKTEREQTGITKDIDTLRSTDEGHRQLNSDKGSADVERPIRKDVSHISGYESVKFKNTDDENNAAYNDKHEHEDNEKLSPIVDDIRHVEEIEALKPTSQTNIENHNTGDSEKLKYPIDVINVQDFTPGQGVALVDGVNINPDGRDVTQPYLTSTEQYEAPIRKVDPEAQQPVGDQYVTQTKASSEQAYLPGANQAQSGGHYVEPTAAVEQVHLQGENQLPSGGHYVEPTPAVEQVYLPGENQLPSGDQYTSESVAASSEQQEFTEQLQQESTYDPATGDVTSEIQEFEDEQNQMFYSEQTNYQYNQDPNAVGDVYNPDGNYDPAMYYGGVQQEAAYPVEINEHEETSQRYDPVYEEQYASKGAEQPQYAEPQQYDQQQYSEQQYGDQQQYSEGQYGDQQQYDEQYVEQQFYGEQQQYSDQQPYAEEQYAEQPYTEQQAEQQGDSNIIATLEEHEPGLSERLQEKQSVEQIEQQLDNEEFGKSSQEAPPVGDIVDESILYAQNADDTATAQPYVENQNPQPI